MRVYMERALYRSSLLGSTQDILDRLEAGPWSKVASKVCDHMLLSLENDDTFEGTLDHATQLLSKLNARKKAVPRALRERIVNTHWVAKTLVMLEETAGGYSPTDSEVHGMLRLRTVWRRLVGEERVPFIARMVERAAGTLRGHQRSIAEKALTHWATDKENVGRVEW